jgi:hypothetical protein
MKELKVTPPEGYIIDEEKSTIYNIVFKKKNELPATWEEFCEQNPSTKGEYFIAVTSDVVKYISNSIPFRDKDYDKLLLSTKEDAEAHLALMQLHRLRNVYRQGWIPDYSDKKDKYSIVFVNNIPIIGACVTSHHFLTFQCFKIAEQFLENFKDLINTAKELI